MNCFALMNWCDKSKPLLLFLCIVAKEFANIRSLSISCMICEYKHPAIWHEIVKKYADLQIGLVSKLLNVH